MNVLVTGASGLLGRKVYHDFKQHYPTKGTAYSRSNNDLTQVDLMDPTQTKQLIIKHKPNILIHCAAERRPDSVQKQPTSSRKLNVESTQILFQTLSELDQPTFGIFISTDYVFDGTNPPYEPNDQPNPLNFYGKSKWEAEQTINKSNCILRVPILYGQVETNAESAVNILVDIIQSKQPTEMDDVQIRFPTFVGDVSWCLLKIVEKWIHHHPLDHIYHFSSTIPMTKYEMCQLIAKAKNQDIQHIVPVKIKSQVDRPNNAQLSIKTTEELLGIKLNEPNGYQMMGLQEYFRDH